MKTISSDSSFLPVQLILVSPQFGVILSELLFTVSLCVYTLCILKCVSIQFGYFKFYTSGSRTHVLNGSVPPHVTYLTDLSISVCRDLTTSCWCKIFPV